MSVVLNVISGILSRSILIRSMSSAFVVFLPMRLKISSLQCWIGISR